MPPRTPQSPQGEVNRTDLGMHFGAERGLFEFAEEHLWNRLRNKQLLECKFRRQHPLNKYIADFYCHKLKYVIEVDGSYHLTKEQSKYDFNRDGEMKELGILVRRFRNEQILLNLEDTIESILKDILKRADLLL
jgi:very-short-patch-repair endonuclease